ncbi:MAG: XRE family transcriptional regulator [Anaerolineae bacterium]|nr:XRE family transcriptional regulator [Anaerolineae bacterium]
MESINQNISRNLKQIRKERTLTLDDLAEISGVSKSMLGEIERGSTNPTILVLWKIADGLKIPLTRLIDDEELDYNLVRAAQHKTVSQNDQYNISSIFPYREPSKSEILTLEIKSHGSLGNSGHRHGVEETILVLDGEIELKLNDETIRLQKGDAIRFKGHLKHQVYNPNPQNAHLLNILNYL